LLRRQERKGARELQSVFKRELQAVFHRRVVICKVPVVQRKATRQAARAFARLSQLDAPEAMLFALKVAPDGVWVQVLVASFDGATRR
jgi:hypothetical protein